MREFSFLINVCLIKGASRIGHERSRLTDTPGVTAKYYSLERTVAPNGNLHQSCSEHSVCLHVLSTERDSKMNSLRRR